MSLANLAETVGRLREKFADLPEEQAIAEAERAVLETRDEMRDERALLETRNSASVPSERVPNNQD